MPAESTGEEAAPDRTGGGVLPLRRRPHYPEEDAVNAGATTHLVDWIRGLIAPLLLGGIGIGAIFFLFQREIMRFAQFLLLAVAVAGIFYTPGIIPWIANGITGALGVH